MRVRGEIAVPGDKSISHRALILSAIASGESRITNLLQSADILSTAGALRSLGVPLPDVTDDIRVRGTGRRGLRGPGTDLDCGNSGTTARLMAGLVAGAGLTARFTGDESLSRRPMERIARPLRAMGARVELGDGGGLPMDVAAGPDALNGIDHVSEAASAQIKSAVLLAGFMADVAVRVHEPAPSRDHTERMLAARGADLRLLDDGVELSRSPELSPLDVRVPADPSSAAFLAAVAALADEGELRLRNVCLNPGRAGFFHLLRRMGAHIEWTTEDEGGEPVGDVVVSPGPLRGVSVDAVDVPSMIDELPLLACIAARAEGETVVTGAGELRVKESDRIAAVVSNLRAVGVEAEELADGMRVVGSRRPLAGSVRTHGDHRLAMAFGVLSALDGSRLVLDDPDCVSVSYPGFWRDLARVTS